MHMPSSLLRLGSAAVFACVVAVAARGQLVANGGFETGDFSGWDLGGNTSFREVLSGAAHSGNFGASFGAPDSATVLAQTSIPTVPGASYSISFWLHNLGDPGGTNHNLFTVSWGSTLLNSLTDVAHFDSYTQFTYSVTADSASTPLTFSFRNDASFWNFDDVSVTQTSSGVPDRGTTVLLLGTGLIGLGILRRKRRAT
jgi:hypothetical protein